MENRLSDALAFVFFGVVIGALGCATLRTQKGMRLCSDVMSVLDDFVALAEMLFDEQVSYEDTVSGACDFMSSTLARVERYMTSERVLSESRTNGFEALEKPDQNSEVILDIELLNRLGRRSCRAYRSYSIMSG